MAKNDTGGQRQTSRRTEEAEETEARSTEDVQERHEKLSDEENAEEFVRSYVQKGGQ